MDDKIIIYDVKDYFQFFIDKYGFSQETAGQAYRYKVADEYGSGCVDWFSLRNGIEICIGDLYLKRSLRIYYKIGKPAFEVTHFLSGRVNYFEEGIGDFSINEGHVGMCVMKNNAEGWMEFPRDTAIKYISVAAYSPFIESFAHGDDLISNRNDYEDISYEKIKSLMNRQPVCPALKAPFTQMSNCRFEGINKLIYLECKAMEIISIAFEELELVEHKKNNNKSIIRTGDKHRIHFAGEIIAENITEPLSIKELAKKAGLNTYKLKVGFKELYGTTIFGYVKAVRIERARRLLLENEEMNINEIANEVGYANPSHFAKAFREKYGVNPRDFRFGV